MLGTFAAMMSMYKIVLFKSAQDDRYQWLGGFVRVGNRSDDG